MRKEALGAARPSVIASDCTDSALTTASQRGFRLQTSSGPLRFNLLSQLIVAAVVAISLLSIPGAAFTPSAFPSYPFRMLSRSLRSSAATATVRLACAHAQRVSVPAGASISSKSLRFSVHSSTPFSNSFLRSFSTTAVSSFSAADAPTLTTPPAASSKIRRSKVRELLDADAASRAPLGQIVRVSGWIRTRRDQKSAAFMQVSDGSSVGGIQVIIDKPAPGALDDAQATRLAELLGNLTTGASVDIEGVLVRSPAKGQTLEILVSSSNNNTTPSTSTSATTTATTTASSPLDHILRGVRLVGACPSDSYPLQKKRHSMEFLREMPHFRVRTNTIGAISRVRSCLAQSAHAFFAERGFVFVQTPIITSADCEGAGERFQVTTRDLSALSSNSNKTTAAVGATTTSSSAATTSSTSKAAAGAVKEEEDFFGAQPAYLTVSGQLTAEAYACALGDVYTFGPTFRAEKSQTTRHLAEFNMLEPEMAFADLHAAMDNAEALIRYTLREVVKRCADDLRFLDQNHDFINSSGAHAANATATTNTNSNKKNANNASNTSKEAAGPSLIDSLVALADAPFPRISYREAVRMLQAEIAKDRSRWAYPDVEFGTDLQTEHERWLAEVAFAGRPVFVHNYPRDIKAFYMRDSDIDPGTVDSFDLLAPGIGEIVGGSQREDRLLVLEGKLTRQGLDPAGYKWYSDLRRYGSVPHAGYGLGFERLVCLVTRLGNIRDAVAFPRYQGYAEF